MALPATDNFNGGIEGEQLTTYSANWTLCLGDFDIQKAAADALASDAAGYTLAGWNADAFDNDQYAQAVIDSLTTYVYIGISVRDDVSTPDDDGYAFATDSTDGCYLFKIVNGVYTQLGSTGSALSAADVIRIEAEGTTITPKVDGVTESPPGAQTDATLASGAAGTSGYDDGEDSRIDDWEGGNLATPAGQPMHLRALAIPHLRQWQPRVAS